MLTYLETKGLDNFVEVRYEKTVVGQNFRNRQVDIIIIDRCNDTSILIDPILRWETNKDDEITMVNEEKHNIYLPTVPYFKQKFTVNEWKIVELWFETRSIVSGFLLQFFKNHGLKTTDFMKIYLEIMKDSLGIIHYNFYARSHYIQNYRLYTYFIFNVIILYYFYYTSSWHYNSSRVFATITTSFYSSCLYNLSYQLRTPNFSNSCIIPSIRNL